jgi:hypothetical protein
VEIRIVVVAAASMLDARLTTLSIGTMVVRATSAFDVNIEFRDMYHNIISANDVDAFQFRLSGHECSPSDGLTVCGAAPECSLSSTTTGGACAAVLISPESEFLITSITAPFYAVKGAVITQGGNHTISRLVSNGNITQLEKELMIDVQAIACDQDGQYGNSEGNGCLTAYCEPGSERIGTCTENVASSSADCAAVTDLFTPDACEEVVAQTGGRGCTYRARQSCQPCGRGFFSHTGTNATCETVAGTSIGITETKCAETGGVYYPPQWSEIIAGIGIQCQLCGAGTFCSGDACPQCTKCPTGKIPNENHDSCVSCAAGTTTRPFGEPGVDECTPCPTSFAGSDGTCTQCSPGLQPDMSNITCEACVVGKAGASGLCNVTCIAGQQPDNGQTTCEACEKGLHSTDGKTCVACGAGKQPSEGQAACELCPTSFAGSDGTCHQCPTGQQPTLTKIACEACVVGNVSSRGLCNVTCIAGQQPDNGQTTCEACGKSLHSTDGKTCVACGAGEQPSATKTMCESCAAGLAGSNGACNPCEAGKNPGGESISCEACPAGKVGPSTSNGMCDVTCAAGTQPNSFDPIDQKILAKTVCEICEPGKYSTDGVTCISCAAYQVSNGNFTNCQKCALGTVLPEGATQCQTCQHPQYTPDEKICQNCPTNQVPDAEGTGCICEDDYYDATHGKLFCYEVGHDWSESDFPDMTKTCPCMQHVMKSSCTCPTQCLACDDTDDTKPGCLECKGGLAKVGPGIDGGKGFATLGGDAGRRQLIEIVSMSTTKPVSAEAATENLGLVGPRAIFQCSLDGCLGAQGNSSVGWCDEGYTGALLGCRARVGREVLVHFCWDIEYVPSFYSL